MNFDNFEFEVTVCPAAEQVVDDKEDAQRGKPGVKYTIKKISGTIFPLNQVQAKF